MENLTRDEVAFAVACLEKLVNSRGYTQTQLEHLSGVKQSQISKFLSRQVDPTPEVLRKLFQALGLKLDDILHEAPTSSTSKLLGYLATPLTAVVSTTQANIELERVVSQICQLASSDEFANPSIDLYWPGHYTHPLRQPEFKPSQVYLTDRSRASTFDFIILFCASPSYGVGQENEIATQAGLPAIRLLPHGISRMMRGSFLQAFDVQYSGDLASSIQVDIERLAEGLREVRKLCFSHRALYRGLNGNNFGERLRNLLEDRSGDYNTFAENLGINLLYLDSLMKEPFAVTNPSVRLLKRMSVLLNVSVAYLLGESVDADPILTESLCSWNTWVKATPGLDASIAIHIKEEWQDDYHRTHRHATVSSFRAVKGVMQQADWDKKYQEVCKNPGKATNHDEQKRLF